MGYRLSFDCSWNKLSFQAHLGVVATNAQKTEKLIDIAHTSLSCPEYKTKHNMGNDNLLPHHQTLLASCTVDTITNVVITFWKGAFFI